MATVSQFIARVESQLGVRYVLGGSSPQEGFDCSGLMYWAATVLGLSIPRTSEAQWAGLPHVTAAEARPGDLVFFEVPTDNQAVPQHVGMISSPGKMCNAPHTGTVVQIDPIWDLPSIWPIGYARLPLTFIPPTPPAPPIAEEDMEPFVATDGVNEWIIWPNGTKTEITEPTDGSVLTGTGPNELGWKYIKISTGTLNAIPTA
jgi:hypothetical protein